jgi:hypothetical protein
MESTLDLSGVSADRAGGHLVKIAKSSDRIREVIDEKTGEIQRFTFNERRREYVVENEPTDARFNRFILQGSARRLLPGHRVSKCIRSVSNSTGDVAILKSETNGKCHYGGLQTCGSVWVCPVCAAKISERRKLEVRSALDTHLAAGGGVEMVTLTFPHSRTDVLKDLMAQLRQAMKVLKRGRSYRSVRSIFQSIGSIRALEVTWGEANGWHPHFHEIWFFSKPLTVRHRAMLTALLYDGWSSACVKSGLPSPNRKRGVHVQPAESAADYIAKFGTEPRWEAASELTKQHVKKSRDSKGRTPFDLLRDYAQGNSRAGALFAEYVEAFFGFSQLFWSPGLKAIFGVAVLTDEEIAAQKEDQAKVVCRMKVDDWKRVLKMAFDARSTLLTLAETGGHDAVQAFLDGLPFIVSSSLTDFSPEPLRVLKKKQQMRLL